MSDYMRHLGGIGYEKVRAGLRDLVWQRKRLRKKEIEALLKDLELVFDAIKNPPGPATGYAGVYGNPYSGGSAMMEYYLETKK